MDVPRPAAERRTRCRDLGKRFGGVRRQHGGVGVTHGRRRTRLCVRSAERTDRLILWRPPPRPESVLGLPRRAQREDRTARVVLPDGPSRSLGLRLGDAAGARRYHG